MNLKLTWLLTLIMAFSIQFSNAQEKTISGEVTSSADGLPLPGVNVIVQGTTRGAQTDFDGKYTIKASTGEILVFSFVGMKEAQATVGASNTINISMSEDVASLDEVVVVAYGTTTKEAFTGSAGVVKSEELELRALTSPIAAIEGNVTGVQFISASGQPGSSPGIVIRGVGTLNGSTAPLIIVDGIDFQGTLNTINQDDIESLTVLKDAASTSLYGSRAANGVIIITTKKGKKGSGVQVNVTSQYGVITRGIDEFDTVSPSEYYELMWQAYKNSLGPGSEAQASATIFDRLGRNPFNVPNDQIVGVDGRINPAARVIAEDLDWYDALERDGSRQSHSVNVAGGGENSNVFLSLSDLHERGYVIESDYKRTTGRLNANLTPTDWLTFGGSINFTDERTTGAPLRGTFAGNPFAFAKDMGSIYSPFLLDPNTGRIIRDAAGNALWDRGAGVPSLGIQSRPTNIGRNALEEAILNQEVTTRDNYGYRFNADITLLEGLKLSLTYGQDIQSSINNSYENPVVGDGDPTARIDVTSFTRTVENVNQIINYNKSFGDHNIELTLGHESFNRNFRRQRTFKTTETASGIYELDNFSVIVAGDGNSTDYRLEGYFARLNYNFNNKYYLSGSVRRDGSSIFTNNRWGTFYSVGGSWRIDQEGFMDNVSFVNSLKLRGSYGQVGNDYLFVDSTVANPVRDWYISQPLYGILPNAGAPGIFWQSTGNLDLQWETSENYDVALEFGLFNNRLSGSFEYYRRNTTDLLYQVPVRGSFGQNSGPDNIGDMYNEGFELGLNARIVDSDNFSWDLGLQASTLKNEITFLPEPFLVGSKRWDEGRSRYDFFIHHFAGVDPSNGDALYYMYEEDADGNVGIPVLNANGTHATTNDHQVAGKGYIDTNTVPDLIGSINNSFSYKNIDLNFLLTYQIGGQLLDYGYADMMHEGAYGASLHPDALNAWRQPGDITNVPRMQNGDPTLSPRLSSRWLTDSDFLALRNVNLAYNLSDDVAEKIGVNKLRLFVSGENLFMWAKRTGLDPQYNLAGTPSGNDYNPNRVISIGVNVGF